MPIDLDRLQSQLLISGLQQSNNPLYQVINQLITTAKNLNAALAIVINGGGTPSGGLVNQNYLTFLDNSAVLPQSKQLVNGPNIEFDDAVAFEREIDITDTGVVPGTYGDASNVPQFEVDAKGRILSVIDIPITGGTGIDHVVLSDGGIPTPQPVNDGAGNFIYVPYTP